MGFKIKVDVTPMLNGEDITELMYQARIGRAIRKMFGEGYIVANYNRGGYKFITSSIEGLLRKAESEDI